MSRPVIYVLAGVNGAGKSSIGGHLLAQAGATWFNPDSFARELVRHYGYTQADANIAAWNEGVRRLDCAILAGKSFAFETTLGGQTIVRKLISASTTHDILVWFCGLRDAEQHIARVRLRVAQGGHDIPEDRIRQRCRTSLLNLLALMPSLAQLRVYDNSRDAAIGAAIPDPVLVLALDDGDVAFPATVHEARATPDWAKPLVEAAFEDRT
ncbi:hypothetical protein AKI39_21395 [Bordetella sp. H567]|nr:hypothetical protein AKI39_21395 [Bordetella sp. H567]